MTSWMVSEHESKIIEALRSESDRAAAIIAHCILEGRLENTLKAQLREKPKIEAKLFGVTRPLTGFAAKNDLAYLLRCYGTKLYKELEIINSIRNLFAHNYEHKGSEIRDFKSDKIAEQCSNLKIIENYLLTHAQWDEMMKVPISERPAGIASFEDDKNREEYLNDNRERFISTVGVITSYLGVYPQAGEYIQLSGDEPQSLLSIRLG